MQQRQGFVMPFTAGDGDEQGSRKRLSFTAGRMLRRGAILLLTLALMLTACAVRDSGGETPPKEAATTEPGELSAEEIAWFNEEFFNGDDFNIRNMFAVTLYDRPENVDLFELFYNGTRPESEITAAEKAALGENWIDLTDCLSSSGQDMDAVLQEHMGLTLRQTEGVGLDNFIYLAEFDAYYLFHGDTNYLAVTVETGRRDGAGTVWLDYTVVTYRESRRTLCLKPTEEGDYLFVSNRELNGAADKEAEPESLESLAVAKLDAAEAAYAWFRGCNQPELGGDTIELFGNKYYPVLDPHFTDMETLRAYLNTLFREDVTETLLASEVREGAPVFAENGGRVYMFGGYAAQVRYDAGRRDALIVTADETGERLALNLTYSANPYGDATYTTQMAYNLQLGQDGEWRFDYFVLPLDLLMEAAGYGLIFPDGQSLLLGRQSGAFPWGAPLSEAGRELWSSDGIDCFRILCQEDTLLSGWRREGADDEAGGTLAGIATINPDYTTIRGISVGMSESKLKGRYPELAEKPWPGEIQVLPAGGATAYDSYYVYAPEEGYRNQTKTVLFGITDGVISVISIDDGMDGRMY